MPRKANQHEFRVAHAGTRTRVELLPGDLIGYDKLPHYTIRSEDVGGEYQLPHLPDEWMFGDRDIFISDSREDGAGRNLGLRVLKAGNLYMEWAMGGEGAFELRISRIDPVSRQVRFLTAIDNIRRSSLEFEDIAPLARHPDSVRLAGTLLSTEQRRNFTRFCMPIREGIFELAQGHGAAVDSAAIIEGIVAARAQIDHLVGEAQARRAAEGAAGGEAAAGGAGASHIARPFDFFSKNPTAEPSNLQELANKLFSVYVNEIGLSTTDVEAVIRAYAIKHRAEVAAVDFADKLVDCEVEIGGGHRDRLHEYFDDGVSSVNQARRAVLGIATEPPPTATAFVVGAGGANTRAMGGFSLTESTRGVGSAVATLLRSADPSTLKDRMLSALAEAKPRFDRAIAEKDARAVGNMFLVIDDALLAINPTVRASVGSWDVIDAAHQAASERFASWLDMIITHPNEKFREQCIAKLIWRSEGPILRHWITPTIAQKLLLALNQDKDELKGFEADSEWTPKERINIAALLISRYLSTPSPENEAFLKRAISSYPEHNLLKFLVEGGVPVTANLYKYALENGHYMAATLIGTNLLGQQRMWADVEMHTMITNNINIGYKGEASRLLERLDKLFKASDDESAPYVGSFSVQGSDLVTQLKGGLAAMTLQLRSIDELDAHSLRNFRKEEPAGQAELKAIVDANNDLVKRVMKARAQVLLARLDDVCKACASTVMENQVLKPLRATLLAAGSLEPFPEVVFDSYLRRMYDKAKPTEIRQAIHDIVDEYNRLIARAKGKPLPSLLDTAYLLGGGATAPSAIAAVGAAGGAGGRPWTVAEPAGAGATAAITAAAALATASATAAIAPAVRTAAPVVPARPLNQFIGADADLRVYPELPAAPLGATEQITIGDLHANPLKLLYSLVRHGVVTLTKADYDEFARLYITAGSNPALTPALLASYRAILSRVNLVPGAAGKVTLIGDETSDRGPNDLLILELMGRMQRLGINYEVLLSNHGVEFVHSYETARGFGESMLLENHSHSMRRLQDSINSGLVSGDEVKALIERAYKPSLKLLSYVVSDDGQEINIFSHAGIGWQSLEALSSRFGVPFIHGTAAELADTIDRINAVFAAMRDRNEVHTLYSDAAMMTGYMSNPLSPVTNPVEFTLWNRFYTPEYADRTSAGHTYEVSFTHGHDSSDPLPEGTHCVDSNIGKHHTYLAGPYNVLVTKGIPSPSALSTPVEAADMRAARMAHGMFAGGAAGGAGATDPRPPTAPGAGGRG